MPATKGHSVYDGETHCGWLVSTMPMLLNGGHARRCVTKYKQDAPGLILIRHHYLSPYFELLP